jgi:hypothetical protein
MSAPERKGAPAAEARTGRNRWMQWGFILAGLAALALSTHAWFELTRIEREGGAVSSFLAALYGQLGKRGTSALLAAPGLLCLVFGGQDLLRRRA